MPRTIFGPGPSFPEDPDRLREVAETKHRAQHERAFQRPLTISAKPNDESSPENNTDGLWSWGHHYWMNKNYIKAHEELNAEDYRRFCFKDCTLYITSATGVSPLLTRHLFDRIYRYWFPSRAEDVDISHSTFFCQPVHFMGEQACPTPVTVHQAIDFHRDLCARLQKVITELGPPAPFTPGPFPPTEEHSLLSPPGEYRIRPSFERCFLFVLAEPSDHSLDSTAMKERGLRVVFPQEADAAMHCCANDAKQGIKRVGWEEQGLDGAAVFHCETLESAMRVVLSADSGRLEGRRERHGYYLNEFLDSRPGTAIPDEPCLCARCLEE